MKKFKRLIRQLMYFLPFIFVFTIIFLLNTTSPLNVGPAGILVVFLLFYGFFLSLFFLMIHTGLIVVKKLNPKLGISKNKIYYLASVIAFMPVFLLALNSIGQLKILDTILVLSLIIVAGFYVIRRTE